MGAASVSDVITSIFLIILSLFGIYFTMPYDSRVYILKIPYILILTIIIIFILINLVVNVLMMRRRP